MNLIISFSARADGNCDDILHYLASENDIGIFFRNMNVHACSDCAYECFEGFCKYHDDEIYSLYESMPAYNKVILIVPMYCGNPSSLYFKFSERCQDYFMHNEERYEEILSKLYIIGVYGAKNSGQNFLSCFEQWFDCSAYHGRVLGIERHVYGQKMDDKILDVEEVKEKLERFLA